MGHFVFSVYGRIAQLVEQVPEEHRVVGSIPTPATFFSAHLILKWADFLSIKKETENAVSFPVFKRW